MIRALNNFLFNAQFAVQMQLLALKQWPNYLHALKTPELLQRKVLENILTSNCETEIGKKYKFSKLDLNLYRETVPIHSYEDLRPFVDRQLAGHSALTSATVEYCALSSGTSGRPKRIPITQEVIEDLQRSQKIAIYCQTKAVPNLYKHNILAFQGATIEGHLDNNIPYGSMSGLMYERSSSQLKNKFIIPATVSNVTEAHERLLLSSAFLLISGPISLISTPNASSILRIYQFIIANQQELLRFCSDGKLEVKGKLNSRLLHTRWQSSPFRKYSKKILESKTNPAVDELFPGLVGVACWMEGNCGYFARKLREQFAKVPHFLELGYLASELRGSIAVDPLNGICLPNINENFLEFIPVDSWENGDRHTLLSYELVAGNRYYIVATTKGGLYRYFMDDIVEATASDYPIPSISFIQKGSGCSSITGEKLYEAQVIQAINEVLPQLTDCILIADVSTQKYKLYVEASTHDIKSGTILDKKLTELNQEYKSKRESGRLNQIQYCAVKNGTFTRRRDLSLAINPRDGQYKAPKLLANPDPLIDYELQLLRET